MRVAQLHRLGSVAVGRGAVADLCACWWHDALALTESFASSSLGGAAAVACCCYFTHVTGLHSPPRV